VKRLASFSLLAVLFLVGTIPVQASSITPINGGVSALELCPQSFCGAAIFSGLFVGQAGTKPFAVGVISVAAIHHPLPPIDQFADITGGVWSLRLFSGARFTGTVTSGSLFNNGDDTFDVEVQMLLGSETTQYTFIGTLSHQVFPPTLIGEVITQ
jgi:hypothetical protein